MTRAIVLFAHGARDPRWAEPFEAVAARVRAAAPGCRVALAFLELMAPTLGDAGGRARRPRARRGSTSCRSSSAPAATCASDLPPLVDALRAAASRRSTFRLHAAIGEHAAVIEAMARRRRRRRGLR